MRDDQKAPFLSGMVRVVKRFRKRIAEDGRSFLERYLMFSKVTCRLVPIPFESHDLNISAFRLSA